MKEILLSDWTLAAFNQREEERRRKEQTEAAVTPPSKMQRSTEPLRSEWTIAALQQRFTALEQRIATLEQMVEEQRRKEQAEAASVAPRAESPHSEAALLTNPILVAPNLVDQPAQFAAARIEDVRVELARPGGEQNLERNGSRTVKFDAQRLERDQIDLRLHENAHVEPGHKKARSLTSFIVTALTAAAIGFGAAIYEVPIEKAIHFRALTKRGLDSIYEGLSTSVKQ